MVRSALLASVSVVVLSLAANAADMYQPPVGVSMKDAPVYDAGWAGFYFGGNGGYGWSARDSSLSGTETLVDLQCTSCPTTPVGSGSKSFSTEGGFGGAQVGYNWQPVSGGGFKDGPARGNFVYGIEADIQGGRIDGSAVIAPVVPTGATGKNELDWFGTLRGRLGYTTGRALFYVTGGLAFGGGTDTLSVSTPLGNPKTVSSDFSNAGYVIGGGVECFINPRWSAKVEYQYIDLGGDSLTATSTSLVPNSPYTWTSTGSLDAQHAYNTVRVGLNYHVGPSYEPLK